MELKSEYKLTEIGMLPTDWRVLPLESITEPSAPIRYGIVQVGPDTPDGIPIVPIKFIKEIETAPLHRTAKAIEERFSGSRISGGDVLLSVKGTIGRVGIVPEGFTGNIAREIARLRVRNEFCPQFVAYQLESDQTQRRIRSAIVGTTRMEFSIAGVRKFLISVPQSKAEQQAVAAALADIDKLISSLMRLIAKKRDLRQGAMQRLLTGQTRLPGFSAPWQVKRLGELGEIRSGGTPATSESSFWNGGIPWCTPTDITALSGKKYLVATARTISERGLAASAAEILPPRSLIMTSRATIGECAINMVPMATNQGFKNIVPSEEVDVEFLYYLMGMQKSRLIALCSGSTFLEISKRQLEHFEVCLPSSKSEQTAVARILSDMDAEMNALEARLIKTRALKQAMMQALLTGRVRLPIQSNAAPEVREYEHA